MDFVYASELKHSYKVYAHFYFLSITKQKLKKRWLCRSVADIFEASFAHQGAYCCENQVPDVVVVMMNPGAARPIKSKSGDVLRPETLSRRALFDTTGRRSRVLVAPDNAQYQLMRLMQRRAWRHLRIINLSDICEGSSSNFSHVYHQLTEYDTSHPESILHPKRRLELQEHLKNVSTIIVAWGRQAVLFQTAIEFLSLVPDVKGLARDYPWYRFASPYRKDQKLSWLHDIDCVL